MIAIVVADQQRACIYLAEAAGKPMKQVAVLINPDARVHEHELGSARPGRVVSPGHMHHALAGHLDFRHQATLQLIKLINQTLSNLLKQQQCDAIMLVADGRMMGLMHKKLGHAVQCKVTDEIAGNWTRRSPQLLQSLIRSRNQAQHGFTHSL